MTFATINCIAVLENPRKTDAAKLKTIALDGQVFLNGSSPSLIGFFHYYNTTDIQFETDVPEAYMVWAKVSEMENQVELHQEGLKNDEYHIMGDIISLSKLGPADTVDLGHHAVLHTIGIASNINKQDYTFDVCTEQWVTVLGGNGSFPTKVHISITGRFKQNKPYLSYNSCVQMAGWIIDVVHSDDRSMKHFIVDLESIIFLGGPERMVQHRCKTHQNRGTPVHLRFNRFTSSLLTSKNLKRPSRDDDDDKGEGSSTGIPGLAWKKRKQTNYGEVQISMTVIQSCT
ncbi:hypothetical protein C8J57DRAFT_1512398 [Mycena rebaudengoi]|nr:hypothetical protein C8J57DRAFT_1512398 [Mycena rebaudengoi]